MVVLIVLCLGVYFLCCWRLMYVSLVYLTELPPIGKIAAHSAYDMFSWYQYLIVH